MDSVQLQIREDGLTPGQDFDVENSIGQALSL